jgi:hypothetical protein
VKVFFSVSLIVPGPCCASCWRRAEQCDAS